MHLSKILDRLSYSWDTCLIHGAKSIRRARPMSSLPLGKSVTLDATSPDNDAAVDRAAFGRVPGEQAHSKPPGHRRPKARDDGGVAVDGDRDPSVEALASFRSELGGPFDQRAACGCDKPTPSRERLRQARLRTSPVRLFYPEYTGSSCATLPGWEDRVAKSPFPR